MNDFGNCIACGKSFRSAIAEARHRHNFPILCKRNKQFKHFTEENAAREKCRKHGTAQCAAICLSHFASQTEDGKCPEVLKVWKETQDKTMELGQRFLEENSK